MSPSSIVIVAGRPLGSWTELVAVLAVAAVIGLLRELYRHFKNHHD